MGRTNRAGRKHRKGTALAVVLALIVCAAVGLWAAAPMIGQQAYPLKYVDEIAFNAAKYGLNPYLVAAVIRTESGFDPDAVSAAGARGLMQLMPETGEWVAEKIGVSDYSDSMLFDPSVNIQFGCWYLSFLEERFDDKPDLVAAAYNAGHNRVSEWLDDALISPAGELKNIPYKETSDYVERVAKAEEKYREYYPDAFGAWGGAA